MKNLVTMCDYELYGEGKYLYRDFYDKYLGLIGIKMDYDDLHFLIEHNFVNVYIFPCDSGNIVLDIDIENQIVTDKDGKSLLSLETYRKALDIVLENGLKETHVSFYLTKVDTIKYTNCEGTIYEYTKIN